jgi:nucleoside-diphosphate-sugar epimerase
MYKDKNVLLIGGGGTLGTYVAKELLKLGCSVDVLCLEEKVSNHEKLSYFKAYATQEFLINLFKKNHYHGIVDFVHYQEVEDYRQIHKLLTKNSEHLIFLSSYRVYANLEYPITENAPHLLEVTEDKEFLEKEKYALSKARVEKFLREESEAENWTIVRPVISFSQKRFDVVTISGRTIIDKAKSGKTIILPEAAKNLTAGLDWAGNTGKLIANLLFKKETYKEAYTISTAQNLTWGEVAEIYSELIGVKFQWTDIDTYVESDSCIKNNIWALLYDRLYDRKIDNRKVLSATGLKREDFLSIKEGIKKELTNIGIEL